jgi:hypothetical protein
MNSKKLVIAFILMNILVGSVFSQDSYLSFYERSLKTTNTGMYVLGSWAIANMAIGGYGWSQYTGSSKYFHQMNFFWNTVNLSIAGFAIYNNYTTDILGLSAEELMSKHIKTENLLLINSALDLGYIGTGFLLRHLSNSSVKRGDLLKGYGNSLILQGSFLLVFDAVLYGILRSQRMDFLDTINMSFSPLSMQFQIIYPL